MGARAPFHVHHGEGSRHQRWPIIAPSVQGRRAGSHRGEGSDPYWTPCDYSTAWARTPAAETDRTRFLRETRAATEARMERKAACCFKHAMSSEASCLASPAP